LPIREKPLSVQHHWKLALLLPLFASACADPSRVLPNTTAQQSNAPSGTVSAQELQKSLQERDIEIASLTQRVRVLEETLTRTAAGQQTGSAGLPVARSEETAIPQGPVQTAQEPTSEASAAQSPAGQPEVPTDSGALDEGGSTALERTLVREGGLLLPEGAIEVEPSLSYLYKESARGVSVLRDDVIATEQANVREDNVEASVTARIGLPWDSQLELTVPYNYIDERTNLAGTEIGRDTHGFGDIDIGLTHQLIRERGWVPDVLAAVTWTADTGKGDPNVSDGLAIGSGYHSLQAGLTFVKSQDPIVFFGSLNYLARLPKDTSAGRLDPGDGVALRLGTALAASPYTSLRFAVSNTLAGKTSLDGRDIAGSETRDASFEIGGGTIVSDTTLLDFSATIGITDDAPDFKFAISLPTRF
jgi:hypothetical protein